MIPWDKRDKEGTKVLVYGEMLEDAFFHLDSLSI